MRTIKFRLVKDNTITSVRELEPNGIIDCPVEWDTAYEFTGLLDKYGKEIFEGDIVKVYIINNDKDYSVTDEDFAGEIIFKNGQFLVNGGKRAMSKVLGHCSKVEVIGNIYENPKLLKNEKTL